MWTSEKQPLVVFNYSESGNTFFVNQYFIFQYNIDTEYDTRSAGSNNNSRETNCNFEEDHHLLQSPHGRHLDEDDEDDTFNQHHNSTQLTNLDNSLLTNSISSTPRRISPILGPNGWNSIEFHKISNYININS